MATPQDCCLSTTLHPGSPTGEAITMRLASQHSESVTSTVQAYRAGASSTTCVLLVPDLLGWTYPNTRLLADFYAARLPATVYVPDLFAGEVLDREAVDAGRWGDIDLPGFLARHSRANRDAIIVALAWTLRSPESGYRHLFAVGFCYGAWAALRLGALSAAEAGQEQDDRSLVDAVSIGHPSLVTRDDFSEISVPLQVLAVERDPVFTPELKLYAFETVPTRGLPFDYQYFPGVEHGSLIRGDPGRQGEREAMERAKRAVVAWFSEFTKASTEDNAKHS